MEQNQIVESALVQFGDMAIYQADLDQLCEEYISTLPVPDMVLKTAGFTGLLDYIYKKRLKQIIDGSKGTEHTNPSSFNYKVLDDIFNNLYIPLCYRFGLCPTVIQFSTLVNISNTLLTDIKNGVYRTNGSKVNPNRVQIVKRWYQCCESATIGRAINESSIGAIFAAKALYNYSDQQTIRIETGNQEQHETAEQIAARHAAAQLPEKPILDE